MNIFYLHGLGSTSASFNAVRNVDVMKNVPVVTHDYAAHKCRPNDAYSSTPLQQAADECVEVMMQVKEKYILAGHSMGNAIAMLVLQKVPEKIAGLASLEGNLMSENCGLVSRKMVEAENDAAREEIKNRLINKFTNSPQLGWREWAHDLVDMPMQVLQDYARELVELCDSGTLLKTFQNFHGPKCYLYGDDYVGHAMVEKLTGIPAYHIPNSGHFLMQDQPEICARYIREVYNSALAP